MLLIVFLLAACFATKSQILAVICAVLIATYLIKKVKPAGYAAIFKRCDGSYEISTMSGDVVERYVVPSDEIYTYVDALRDYVVGSDCMLRGTIDIPGQVCDYAEQHGLYLHDAYCRLSDLDGYRNADELLDILIALQN